jgi:hypothetical protein
MPSLCAVLGAQSVQEKIRAALSEMREEMEDQFEMKLEMELEKQRVLLEVQFDLEKEELRNRLATAQQS